MTRRQADATTAGMPSMSRLAPRGLVASRQAAKAATNIAPHSEAAAVTRQGGRGGQDARSALIPPVEDECQREHHAGKRGEVGCGAGRPIEQLRDRMTDEEHGKHAGADHRSPHALADSRRSHRDEGACGQGQPVQRQEWPYERAMESRNHAIIEEEGELGGWPRTEVRQAIDVVRPALGTDRGCLDVFVGLPPPEREQGSVCGDDRDEADRRTRRPAERSRQPTLSDLRTAPLYGGVPARRHPTHASAAGYRRPT